MTSANHDPAPGDRNAHTPPASEDVTARRPDERSTQSERRQEPHRQEPHSQEPEPQRRPEYADQPKKASRSGGLWAALIIGTIILILLLIFIVQNNVPADFTYMAWQFQLPLGVAMLFAAIAGALIAVMIGSIRMIVLGRRVKRLERQRREMRRTLDS